MSQAKTPDRIEKQILIKAPQPRVWRALTDSGEFGQWFRVKLDGRFEPGRTVRGNVLHAGYEHIRVEMNIDRMEAEHLFSYRWHPYPADPKVYYSSEPTTLVEFRLAAENGGTLLTVVESGFDRIPAGRRDEAFRMNDGGWAAQVKNIQRHAE